jgi:hypothetical protein
MVHLDLWLFFSSLAGLITGGWGICWARTHPEQLRGLWGRRLFVATFLVLGGSGLIAALSRAQGLASLGLLAGFLLIAMLWEAPGKRALPAEEAARP